MMLTYLLNKKKVWRRPLLVLLSLFISATFLFSACAGDGSDPRGNTDNTIEHPDDDQTAGEDETSTGGDDTEPQGETFSFTEIKVGDVIAGMTVRSIDALEPGGEGANGERDPHNAVVGFSGQATLTARYTYYPPDDQFLGNAVCMHVGDGLAAGLPHMIEDNRYTWFCFHNEDEARAAFKEPGAGVATVTIDDYTIIHYPSEVWNTATLVEAEVLTHRPLTKEITVYPEGMEEKRTFRLTDIFWIPVTTYMPNNWQAQGLELENAVSMQLIPEIDLGMVEITVFDPEVSGGEVDAAVQSILKHHGFNDVKEESVPEWAMTHYAAQDNSAQSPAEWRRAHVYVGQHEGRYFYILDLLNRLEAGDGWGPSVDVILNELQWETGEPLAS